MCPKPAAAPSKCITHKDRIVLVAALIGTKNGAIKCIQEVYSEFDAHPLVDAGPLDDGDILIEVTRHADIAIAAGTVANSKRVWVIPTHYN